jgi:hypothetical protein
MRLGRSKVCLLGALLLGSVQGCFCNGPLPLVAPVLTGVVQSSVVTLKFDGVGQCQSAVMTQSRLLDAAAKLGIYDPTQLAAADDLLKCLTLGQETALTSKLFVVLEAVTQDAGTITVTLRFNKRNDGGQLIATASIQIVLAGLGSDQDGNTTVDSVTVVGSDGEGHEVFRDDLGPETLIAIAEDRAPTAVAEASSVQANAGQLIVLSAANSVDPDGDAITFHWEQTAGEAVTLSGAELAQSTFTAPELNADSTLTFQVTVNDGTLSSTATVAIAVRHVNHTPLAKVGAAMTVDPGDTVTLDASSSSDPDGDALTFAWTTRPGTTIILANSAIATPSFIAPAVTEDTILEFEVTVSDGSKSASEIARVVVAGPPSILKLIPADASFVVASTNMLQSLQQITTWVQAPALPIPEEMRGALGRPAVVFGRASDQLMVIVLEWTRSEFVAYLNANVEAVSETDEGDGVTSLGESSMKTYVAEASPGLLVLAPTKAAVLAVRGGSFSILEKLDLSWLKGFKAGGVLLYDDTQSSSPLQPLLSALPSIGGNAETDARCLVLNPALGTLTSWQRLKAGSSSLQRLAGYQQTTGTKLLGLPDEPALLAVGGLQDAPLLGLMAGMTSLPAELSSGLTSLRSLHPITAVSVTELSGGDAGLLGFAQTATVDDADQYITVLSGIVSDLDQMAGGVTPGGFATFEPSTTDVPGRIVYIMSLAPAVMNGSPLETALFGAETMRVRIAKVDARHVVFTIGGGSARLVQMVDAVAAGTAPMAARPLIADSEALLPATNIVECHFAPAQMSKLMYDIGQAAGTISGTDPGAATSVLGLSFGRDGNSGRLDIAMPAGFLPNLEILGALGIF